MRLFVMAVLALLSTTVVSGIWSALLLANLRASPAIPWAVAVMAALLWVAWHYAARRADLRANGVSPRVFAAAVVAGACGLAALTGLWIVLFQTGLMHGNRLPDFSSYPALTVIAVLAMASLAGALVEEAGFRGFLQAALEREFSAPLAVAIAAVAVAPGHGLTQGFAWPTVLFYLLVDLMLGVTASICDSIWPGVVVHATGLLIFFAVIWPADALRPVARNALADGWFWIHAAQAMVFGALAIAALRRLAGIARAGRPIAAAPSAP